MTWQKVALILGALAISVAAWLSRWGEPVQISSGAYVLDRATGQWWLMYGDTMMRVKPTE